MQLPNPNPNPHAACRGAVDPRLLLGSGVLLLVAVLWVFLAAPESGGGEEDPGKLPEVNPAHQLPDAAELELNPNMPLAGTGPLEVELHYLGSRGDSLATVRRPGVLVGKIYGADGNGLEGVEMRIQGGPQDGLTAFSGADGLYRMEGLIPGLHFIHLSSRQVPTAVRMQRVSGQRETKRDFFFGETLSVTFHVRDHENKDLEGALLTTDLGLRRASSDDKGMAQLDGVPGGRRVVLDVRAEGHVPVRFEMNLFAARLTGESIELPALPIGGKVRGRVKSWPGGPLPTVTMVPRATNLGAFQVVWEDWQDITTDRGGNFLLKNVPITHLLDVRASHPMGVCDPRVRAVQPSISSAATANFVIREGHATVGGQVVDTLDQPIEGVLMRLAAVNPDQVLGSLYPGLGESPVGVRLPVPAQLLREARTDRDGNFRFALGDHPQGTGHLLLTAEVPGKRSARREVKTVGKEFRIVMEDVRLQGQLRLFRSDDGPIPEAMYFLDGEMREDLSGLEQGFYHVVVKRGDLVLKQVTQLWVEGDTGLDLRP